MTDSLSPEKRSCNMSKIHNKDTKIEVKVRKYLFSKKFRYLKNVEKLPGKPDIVLPKYKTVIFVNGCFWHRHDNCKYATTPKTRTNFWEQKFHRNVANDKKNIVKLRSDGWKVIVVWECELKRDFDTSMAYVIAKILEEV